MFFINRILGIDLGSDNIRIFNSNSGKILEKSTYIAFDKTDKNNILTDKAAKKIYKRESANFQTYNPIRRGVITNPTQLVELLKVYIQSTNKLFKFIKPILVVSEPTHLSNLEKRVFVDTLRKVGKKEIYFGGNTFFASLGVGVQTSDLTSKLILDIGSSKTEASILALGYSTKDVSIKKGGLDIDNRIVEHIESKYNLKISHTLAENIKIKKLTATPNAESNLIKVTGFDLSTSLPKQIEVNSSELDTAIYPILEEILDHISGIFDTIQPESISDVIRNGVFLTGGFSKLKHFDRLIEAKLKIKVNVIEKPERAIINGIEKLIDLGHIESHKKHILTVKN